MTPEFLTSKYIGQMNFDYRKRDGRYGIAQGDRRVGQSARIDDDAGRVSRGLVNGIYQLAFVITLRAAYRHGMRAGPLGRPGLDVGQGDRAVYIRFAGAE